jgi:hypothetical protein
MEKKTPNLRWEFVQRFDILGAKPLPLCVCMFRVFRVSPVFGSVKNDFRFAGLSETND